MGIIWSFWVGGVFWWLRVWGHFVIRVEMGKLLFSWILRLYSQVLLFVMVYGENPFANVVKAEECILHFPTSIQVSMVNIMKQTQIIVLIYLDLYAAVVLSSNQRCSSQTWCQENGWKWVGYDWKPWEHGEPAEFWIEEI